MRPRAYTVRPYRSGRSFTVNPCPRSVNHRGTSSRLVNGCPLPLPLVEGLDGSGFACQSLPGPVATRRNHLDRLGDLDQPGQPMGPVGHIVPLAGNRAVEFPDSRRVENLQVNVHAAAGEPLGNRCNRIAYKGRARLHRWAGRYDTTGVRRCRCLPGSPAGQPIDDNHAAQFRAVSSAAQCSSSFAEIPAGLLGSKSRGNHRRRIMSPSLVNGSRKSVAWSGDRANRAGLISFKTR